MPDPITAAAWPVHARPTVQMAVQAPLMAKGFDHVYRHPTCALHLHDYDGTIRLAGGEYALSPGTLTWSPAERDSSYDLPQAGTHWCVHFLMPSTDGPVVEIPLVQQLGPRQQEGVARFVHLIRLRSILLSQPDEAVAAALSVACQELILWAALLSRGATPAAPARSAIVEKTVDYIDRNLHRPLRAGDLIAAAGVTQNYLARLFRRHTGQTLPAYVMRRRMSLAQLLLTTTDLPIKQVALRIGIRDAQQFNKLFRKTNGLSPTATRARHS